MTKDEIMEIMLDIDPLAVRVPPGIFTVAQAVEAKTIAKCAALLDAEHEKRKHMDNHAAYYARMLREMER